MTDAPLTQDDGVAPPAPRANRPVTLGYRVEYAAVRALFLFFRAIGVDAASSVSGGFLRRVGPMLRGISRRSDDNLRAAFPDWTEDRIRRTTAGVWENLGRTAAEFAHLEAFRAFEAGGRVEIAGIEKLEALRARGGPFIFVSGHFANWEVLAIALRQAGFDSAVVYRAANNPLVDRLIIDLRARVIGNLQIPKGKRGGRQVIDALKAGKSLAMLVDQKLNDGIPVPFLGRDAMTAPAAARLSLKFGAPVVYAGLERTGGAHHRIALHDPIDFAPTGDAVEDVRALTILINQCLERDIRARPEQWLWLHRRWPKKG